MDFFSISTKEVFSKLNSSEKGLSSKEAKKRLSVYGLNEITEKEKISALKIFFDQFKSFIVWVLIGAVIISIFIGEFLDAGVIGIILVLNAIIGFKQEYSAEKAIEALQKMASLKAKVFRDGKEVLIDSKELVPGDVIILETGEKIPADSRMINSINLEAQESALTGESLPVKKIIDMMPAKSVVADRKNMIYSGTIITAGRGMAIVTGTGMNSEIGKIAEMIQTTETKLTPLQLKLRHLGHVLGIATIAISIIVFLAGVLSGKEVGEMAINAISLAVAAIPEGLPAVVTIALSLGVTRMIKRHALVRKLPSVETLGGTTVICTDKTGTLTCNQMTVTKIYANGNIISVTGRGYKKEGTFMIGKKIVDAMPLVPLLRIGTMNNDAKITDKDVIGDPTEASLIVCAAKAGIDKEEMEKKYPRIGEIGFDSKRKRMSTFHKIDGKKTVYCKGAPDVILHLCDRIWDKGRVRKITSSDKKKILKINESFSSEALRVLGFAYKNSSILEEKNLIFVGLQGMIDPPRKEVKEAIAKCTEAGVKVVMITGDYKGTAMAIAGQIGIKGKAINGEELEKIKDLKKVVDKISVYARVDPAHKSRIVEALKANGHIIAMTGDGVNDAPALKDAHIGISMGITGTDVAKEASDMILTDDNFASIVSAIEEGRSIYDNIKKFVEYLLSSNLGEILTIFLAIIFSSFFGGALPLIAIQILWVNLVTDGFPALALSVDPAEPDIMRRKPRGLKDPILSRAMVTRMIVIGIIMMAGTLFMFQHFQKDYGLQYAQTIAFCTLVVFQLFNVLNCRSEYNSLFRLGVFSNIKLWIAIFVSIVLQLAVIYTPLSVYFKTTPIEFMHWGWIIMVGSSVLIYGELAKLVRHFVLKARG